MSRRRDLSHQPVRRSASGRLLVVASLFLLGVVAIAGGYAALGHESAVGKPRLLDPLTPHPVAGGFVPDRKSLRDCRTLRNNASACYEQAFGNLAYVGGPRAALTEFDRAIRRDPIVEQGCHRIAHTIGSAVLARFDGDVGRAFSRGSSSCWSGYYHGILERALSGVSTKPELVAAVGNVCHGVKQTESRFVAYQCVHGIGHGLMIRSGLDLRLSLEICEGLETAWDQTSCDGGVFMENFNTSYGVKSRFVRDDDPLYPCNDVADRHKLYCYLQVTDRILVVTRYDWKRTAAACGGVAAARWRAICFQSYGRSASGMTLRKHPAVVSLCELAGKGNEDCVYGAVRDMTAHAAGGKAAAAFCVSLDEPLRPRCFFGLGTILSDLTPDAQTVGRRCAALTRRYLDFCTLRQSPA